MSLNQDQICHAYLQRLYQPLSTRTFAQEYKSHNLSTTQGEILYPSINKLIAAMSLTPEDVFYDLGSGAGKITTQVFLKTAVKEAAGIELIPELHQCSLKVAAQIEKELPEFYQPQRKLSFIHGDFLETSFQRATVVFLNSTCFSQTLLRQLVERINRCQHIHTVLSLRPLAKLKNQKFVKTLLTECSWDSVLGYLYQK